MKLRTGIVTVPLATIALVTAAILVPAVPASADDFCGRVITSPGTTITLTEDLHCPDRGIVVRANSVTIDLHGHTIYGAYSDDIDPVLGAPAGVTIYHAGNTVVEGGAIEGFWNGVYVDLGAAVQLHDLRISRTHTDGIQLEHATNVALANVTVNGPGPDAPDASGIRGNNVTGFSADALVITGWPGAGLLMQTVAGFSFRGSSAVNNGFEGINLSETAGRVLIDRSTVDHNYDGITIVDSSRTGSVTISNTTTNGNTQNGLWTTNATNVAISAVTANDNGSEGIWLDSGLDAANAPIPFVATVQGSTANRNAHSGISMSGAGRWTVRGNDNEGNHESGFAFWGGQVTLSDNLAALNTQNGFTWYEGSRGTSTRDTATKNYGAGVVIGTEAWNGVTMVNASVTSNHHDGLLVNSGVAQLSGGSYSYNGLDGVRAGRGEVDALRISAFKNRFDGIAFTFGSAGTVNTVDSSKNGRYGICIAKGLSIHDVPPNVLLGNRIAPRGSFCSSSTIQG